MADKNKRADLIGRLATFSRPAATPRKARDEETDPRSKTKASTVKAVKERVKPTASKPKAMKPTNSGGARRPGAPPSLPHRPGELAPKIPDSIGPKQKTASIPKTPAELRGKEALNYVKERVDLSTLDAESPPPKSMDREAQALVKSTLERGAQILRERPTPDEEGNFIGFDFGTSSTKIVIRQQGAGELAYALPTPRALRVKERRRSQDHLWRSVVWFNPATQLFSLTPGSGAIPIEGFKTGLIGSSGSGKTRAPNVTFADASVAYLAMLIAYVLGHLKTAAPAGFYRERHFSRFHFGIPVASRDEPRVCSAFQRVIGAAFEVAPIATQLGLQDVQAALAAAPGVMEIASDTPFIMYEELAGVIAGYKASPDHRTGPHVIVDVGASTLDVATFHIPAGDEKVLVFMSGVDLLGAEALRSARRKEVPDRTFKSACNQHAGHVLSITRKLKDRDFLAQNGIPKPLLFVGGGRLTDVHSETFSHYTNGLEAPLRTPIPGAGLRYDPKTDVERLLLAWGLSQDEIDLPVIKPPSEIEDEVRRSVDFQDRYVDKSMT